MTIPVVVPPAHANRQPGYLRLSKHSVHFVFKMPPDGISGCVRLLRNRQAADFSALYWPLTKIVPGGNNVWEHDKNKIKWLGLKCELLVKLNFIVFLANTFTCNWLQYSKQNWEGCYNLQENYLRWSSLFFFNANIFKSWFSFLSTKLHFICVIYNNNNLLHLYSALLGNLGLLKAFNILWTLL